MATIVAFALSRTNGLLGFKETSLTTESMIALVAEALAIVALVPVGLAAWKARSTKTEPAPA